MTEQQQRFVAEYIACGGNATKAAIAAGYSRKCAKQHGYRMLREYPEIKAAVESALRDVFLTYAVGAYKKLYDLMSGSADERIQFQAAQMLINSTGYRLPEKVDISVSDQRTDEELKAFIAANAPKLIQAEVIN